MTHSPFHIIEDFISPLHCEQLVQHLALRAPDKDPSGNPLKHTRLIPQELTGDLDDKLSDLAPALQHRYTANEVLKTSLLFQQYFEDPKNPAETHRAEGWKYARKKWTKTADCDLVGYLWLKTFHDSVPLDSRFEVYGGKLEFPTYDFSLTPMRGTLVVFPATPHFVHAISHVMLGTLEQLKMSFKLRANGLPWIYNATNFPGTYRDWFFNE